MRLASSVILLAVLLLAPARSFAWGMHFLITDRALPPGAFSEPVPPEPLESFLKAEAAATAAVFDGYYDWLKQRGSRRFLPQKFNAANPTLPEFLHAARFNPNVKFRDIRTLLPGRKRVGRAVQLSELSPYETEDKNFPFLAEDATGLALTSRDVLDTYSDEPDWWIDARLWSIKEYGYGEPPYGIAGENSGDGAFHTQFAHEPWLIRLTAPEVSTGMAFERAELMRRLAIHAWSSGHRYWGLRFTAWGLHYLEDIAQPYHSKAVPQGDLWFYLRFALSRDKEKIKRETMQLVINRHYLVEDFAKTLQQASYLKPSPEIAGIVGELGTSHRAWSPGEDLPLRISEDAAVQARALDRAVVLAYGPHLTQDPAVAVVHETSYDSGAILSRMSSPEVRPLVAEVRDSFERTGLAVRTFLRGVMER